MKKRSTIMWCLLAEMQTVFQDMPIAGELVKQNTGEMWLNLINLTDSVTEGRIISCLCLKQPLICFLFYPIISQRLEKAELPESGWHFQCGTDGFFLSERPQITSVFLCLDNDHAGNEASEKIGNRNPGRIQCHPSETVPRKTGMKSSVIKMQTGRNQSLKQLQ